MVEKVKQDPLSPKMLAVDGKDVMEIAKIEPGPKVGQILSILLDEVLEDPLKKRKKYLKNRIQELIKLKDKELEKTSEGAKEKRRV